jgi:hypothetical protein
MIVFVFKTLYANLRTPPENLENLEMRLEGVVYV